MRRSLIATMQEHVMLVQENAHAQTQPTHLLIAVVGISILISKGYIFHDLTQWNVVVLFNRKYFF